MSEETPIHILVVDDHPPLLRSLARFLRASGFRVTTASSGRQALELAAAEPPQIALLDLVLKKGMNGMELLRKLRASYSFPVLMMTGFQEAANAKEALEAGAYEFLTKPIAPEMLPVLVQNALDHARLLQAESRRRAVPRLGALVGGGAKMSAIFAQIEQVAPMETRVLITGETGTGKSLAAREIHRLSERSAGPFVHVNCAAIQPGLFESELFGHEEGAFTGATSSRAGRFERAGGGTIFLDEVDCLPSPLQAKLLQVLESGEYERVGGTETLSSDARVIAASNADLPDLVEAKEFRADLYYRLAEFPIHLPALRERLEDLESLVEHFVDEGCTRMQRNSPLVAPEAIAEARSFRWPGNLRELSNAVTHALVLGGDEIRTVLPPTRAKLHAEVGESLGELLREILPLPLSEATERFHIYYFAALLARAEGNKRVATELAQVDRRTLQRYIKRLGIENDEGEPETPAAAVS